MLHMFYTHVNKCICFILHMLYTHINKCICFIPDVFHRHKQYFILNMSQKEYGVLVVRNIFFLSTWKRHCSWIWVNIVKHFSNELHTRLDEARKAFQFAKYFNSLPKIRDFIHS